MGKGVANGLPISIVCGSAEFMEPFDEIFFSFTFGGETTSIAAALATIRIMERENFWEHAWNLGNTLQEGFRSLVKQHGLEGIFDCVGLPPWTVVTVADSAPWSGIQLKTLFQQEMLRHRILFSGSQFISLAHTTSDIDRTLEAYADAMRTVRFALDSAAVDKLTLGKVNEIIFRRA